MDQAFCNPDALRQIFGPSIAEGITEMREDIIRIEEKISSSRSVQDWVGLKMAIHQLRADAGYLECTELYDLCSLVEYEEMGSDGTPLFAERMNERVGEILNLSQRLLTAIRDFEPASAQQI
jgi:hypothetical protein